MDELPLNFVHFKSFCPTQGCTTRHHRCTRGARGPAAVSSRGAGYRVKCQNLNTQHHVKNTPLSSNFIAKGDPHRAGPGGGDPDRRSLQIPERDRTARSRAQPHCLPTCHLPATALRWFRVVFSSQRRTMTRLRCGDLLPATTRPHFLDTACP